MAKIAVLPPALASQIAAGEVVERPASALKELLENSLDAGAERCDVEIEGGGITALRIRDDGCGMSPEDAELALLRHATSKLSKFEDLDDLPSFGFRGEAIPSIASVSRFTLQTRSEDADAGTEIFVEAGHTKRVQEVGMAQGTFIEVRDLFYNVPARRKFLRASGTESGHIGDVLENAALGCPSVTFTLSRDGRKAKEWLRAQSRAERARHVFDNEELAACEGTRGPLQLEAYLSRPERARAGSAGLKLFCNERPIRDRALLATICQAYGSVLERGRYPRGVLYLNLPPQLVDINVHPQKTEVRFADNRAVADAVYQLLSEGLAQAFSLPAPVSNRWSQTRKEESALPSPAIPPPLSRSQLPAQGRAATRPSLRADDLPDYAARQRAANQRPNTTRPEPQTFFHVKDAGAQTAGSSSYDTNTPQQTSHSATAEPPNDSRADAQAPVASTELTEKWAALKFVAQVHSTYLVCEGKKGLYLLDQHAAAERVTFDRLKKRYSAGNMTSQSLLFPMTLEVQASYSELVEAEQAQLQRLGFELRVHTETTLSLHAVPSLVQRAKPDTLALDLLRELSRQGRDFSDAVDGVLATMACHGSVRAGDLLSHQEASALLSALDEVDFAGHCPHGRPVVTFTAWSELERKVGRR